MARSTGASELFPVAKQRPLMMSDSELPRVCVIMPFLNEAADLPDVLASLEVQTYPRSKLRLEAVDNGSADSGPHIVNAWLRRTQTDGEVIYFASRSIPQALNVALRLARADEYIVRLDAHAIYPPEYIRTLVTALLGADKSVCCVGGSRITDSPLSFEHAIVEALFRNPMGLGGGTYRPTPVAREIENVYLGVWRPGVVQRAGGWNPAWKANEDSELSARLRAAGGRIVQLPVATRYRVKRGLFAEIRQWFGYGFWKAQTIKLHRASLRPRQVVPLLALLAGLGLALSPARIALVPLVAVYWGAIIYKRRSGESPVVTAASLLFFPATHIAFACGLILGSLFPPPPAVAVPSNEPETQTTS
jgi:succinoglycan biosynthesis protein ExoA